MYALMYDYIYVLFDNKHWHRGLNPFWPHKFGFKPLLGLEPMGLIRPQLLVSHANHSATETSHVCMYYYYYYYFVGGGINVSFRSRGDQCVCVFHPHVQRNVY